MILIPICLALIALTGGTFLLAKAVKDTLGLFFKIVAWFIIVASFLSHGCVALHTAVKICTWHSYHEGSMKMGHGGGCPMGFDNGMNGDCCRDGMRGDGCCRDGSGGCCPEDECSRNAYYGNSGCMKGSGAEGGMKKCCHDEDKEEGGCKDSTMMNKQQKK